MMNSCTNMTSSHAKNRSKPFGTTSNVLKTVSNKFFHLRQPLNMVCTKTTSISRCCMSSSSVHRRSRNAKTMQFLYSTFPAQISSEDGMYGSEDGNIERHENAISKIHICRQHVRCFDQNNCFLHRIQI